MAHAAVPLVTVREDRIAKSDSFDARQCSIGKGRLWFTSVRKGIRSPVHRERNTFDV